MPRKTLTDAEKAARKAEKEASGIVTQREINNTFINSDGQPLFAFILSVDGTLRMRAASTESFVLNDAQLKALRTHISKSINSRKK